MLPIYPFRNMRLFGQMKMDSSEARRLVVTSSHQVSDGLIWPTAELSAARASAIQQGFCGATFGSLEKALAMEEKSAWVDWVLKNKSLDLILFGELYLAVSSTYTFGRFAYLMRSQAGRFLIMVSAGIPNQPQLVFSPGLQTFFWRKRTFSIPQEALINSLKSIPDLGALSSVGEGPEYRPVGYSVLVPPVQNFAHQVGHFHSGLERLEQDRILQVVQHAWDSSINFLGEIGDLYPSIAQKTRGYESDHELNRLVDEKREILLPATGFFITERQKERYLSSEDTPTSSAEPKIWLSLRARDRIWLEQEDGFLKLVAAVQQIYPTALFYLDGFSTPRTGETVKKWGGVMSKLAAIAERIRASSPNPERVHSLIGATLGESIAIAKTIDLYVSGVGSAQHKVGWFSDGDAIIIRDPKSISLNLEKHSSFSCAPAKGRVVLLDGEPFDDPSPHFLALEDARAVPNFSLSPSILTREALRLLSTSHRLR